MRGVLLDSKTGRPEQEHRERPYEIPPHIMDLILSAKQNPEIVAARQYFRELQEPYPTADLTAVTAAAATIWWSSADYTPVGAKAAKAYQKFKITAGGVITTTATPGTLIIDPRYGTTAGGGVSLGANTAVALPASLTNVPWLLECWCEFRNVNNVTASSTTGHAYGRFQAGSGTPFVFGGTVATTLDTTIASGWEIVGTFSVATGSLTPRKIDYEILN